MLRLNISSANWADMQIGIPTIVPVFDPFWEGEDIDETTKIALITCEAISKPIRRRVRFIPEEEEAKVLWRGVWYVDPNEYMTLWLR